MRKRISSIQAYVQARYHEKAPRTMADIANSSARRKVDAARVPRASFDMLTVWEGMKMGEVCVWSGLMEGDEN